MSSSICSCITRMRFSCSAVDPDTTSEMPRVVEGSQPTSDHAVLAVLPSMGVEGPGGGRAAAAGELEGPAGGRLAAAGDELAIRAGVAPRG